MQDRPIKTTSGFEPFSVVLDVPASAVNIAFGLLLSGAGDAWMNAVRLEVLDESVAVPQ